MNKSIALVFAALMYVAPGAHAGWVCGEPFMTTTNPQECKAAGSQQTAVALATAFIKELEKKNPNRAPYALTECTPSGKEFSCRYTFYIGTSQFSNTVSAVQDATASCPETLESRGDNSSIVKTGDKYNVVWSVRQVTDDICHNSCSYLASSASVSTCYRVAGSSDTGFCNYVVGLNSASPSCASESGYQAPATGDSLDAGSGSGGDSDGGGDEGGDGGGDGSNGGSGDGSGNGGSDGSGFDGELKFSSPGELDAKSIIEREQNGVAAEAFVLGLQTSLNESGFGKAIEGFKQSITNSAMQGVCPTPSFEVFQKVMRFDSHCDLFASLAGIASIVFMAGWSIAAIRIVLSA